MSLDDIRDVFEQHGAEDMLYYYSESGILNVFYHKKGIDSLTSLRHDIDSLDEEYTISCWQFEAIQNEETIERVEEVSTQLIS
jgi:hypothetical protein